MPSIKNITKDATKAVENVTDEASKQTVAARAEATRVATDPTPLYAAVGLTDTVAELARETVTETVARANKLGKALAPKNVSKTVSARASEVSKRAESLPGKAVSDVTEGLGKVQGAYQELAKRGEGLVGRVKGQQATKDLTKQVNTVVEQGRQLLGSASKGVTDTRSAAKATVTKSRRQAADAVADVVAGEDVTVATKPAAKRPAASKKAATSRNAATKRTTSKPVTKAAATKSAATKAATKPATKAASKPATKAAATKTAPSKSAATKDASKPVTKAPATKSAATTSTSTAAAKAAAEKSTTTTAAAKRTVTTARNAATKTADAAQDVVSETAKTADKVVDATTAAASKTGN